MQFFKNLFNWSKPTNSQSDNKTSDIPRKGRIKFFNRKRGYGFIETADKQDIFVHVSNLEDRVNRGDRVQFELTQGKKGVEAREVRRTS